jgi:hypothetical protein
MCVCISGIACVIKASLLMYPVIGDSTDSSDVCADLARATPRTKERVGSLSRLETRVSG